MPLVGGLGFRGDSLGFGFPVSVGSEFRRSSAAKRKQLVLQRPCFCVLPLMNVRLLATIPPTVP